MLIESKISSPAQKKRAQAALDGPLAPKKTKVKKSEEEQITDMDSLLSGFGF